MHRYLLELNMISEYIFWNAFTWVFYRSCSN